VNSGVENNSLIGPAKQPRPENQMPTAADREEFSYALRYGEDYYLDKRHKFLKFELL
jgi:hypothetical protein